MSINFFRYIYHSNLSQQYRRPYNFVLVSSISRGSFPHQYIAADIADVVNIVSSAIIYIQLSVKLFTF